MDAFLETINLSTAELIRIGVIGLVLFVGLVGLRFMFKMKKTMLQGGCFLIVLIVAAFFFLSVLS